MEQSPFIYYSEFSSSHPLPAISPTFSTLPLLALLPPFSLISSSFLSLCFESHSAMLKTYSWIFIQGSLMICSEDYLVLVVGTKVRLALYKASKQLPYCTFSSILLFFFPTLPIFTHTTILLMINDHNHHFISRVYYVIGLL